MEYKRLKILLLVAEPWTEKSAGGNVINNIFGGMDAEFAQIYCSKETPHNKYCSLYYQIDFGEALSNIFTKKKIGNTFFYDCASYDDSVIEKNKDKKEKYFNLARKMNSDSVRLMKKMIMYHSNWQTEELDAFIQGFEPDVIFAPCYASPFMLSLTRYVKTLTGKKVVTYSGDANYTLRQFSLSPAFWIDRLWVRKHMRKTFPYYDLFYSMSEDEITEMSPIVKKQMKIFRKGYDADTAAEHESINRPMKMIYAGGIYINRWKVLAKIGDAVRNINRHQKKLELHIYTATPITEKQRKKLNDNHNIYLHEAVSEKKLADIYSESDIAIHCESMELTQRYRTRISFSTKIVDCLKSGCAVLAVAWEEHTGIKYLSGNDAAVCVTKIKDIEPTLRRLADNPDLVKEYSKKALALLKKNHDIKKIREDIKCDFEKILSIEEQE